MIPTIVQWELTGRCNHLCQHCYRLDSNGKEVKILEFSDEEMMNVAKILVDNKLFFVTLTGGEPLIRKGLVVELVNFLSENGVRVSLNTNLVLVDEEILSLDIYGILVSCPSSNRETYSTITNGGSYEVFEEKLRLLISSKRHHTVNMVVSKSNFGQIISTAERMSELGVKRFAATPVSLNAEFPRPELLLSIEEFQETMDNLVWIYENLGMQVDVMEALPKCVIPKRALELNLPFVDRSCYAGRRNGTISPTGFVRPCGHNPNNFGNILSCSVEGIWDNLYDWRGETGNEHRNCLACDIESSCSGGCSFSGHPVHPDSIILTNYLNLPNDQILKRSRKFFSDDVVLKPYKNILSRVEGDNWLLCSNSPRNILSANKELYAFISLTRDLPPMSLKKIAEISGTNCEDENFQSVITELVDKSFFIRVDNQKSFHNSDVFLS